MSEARGFAGLTSLASTLPDMPVFGLDTSPGSAPAASAATARPKVVRPEPTRRPPPPDQPGFWTPGKAWAAIGAVVAAIVIWTNVDDPAVRPAPSTPTYTPSPSSSSPSHQQPAAPAAPVSPRAETMDSRPAIGNGLTLTTSEIQYCLAQRIRVETMLATADNSKSSHVTNVNAFVEDYNARCSNFRFRDRDRDAAWRNVEARRPQLVAAARAQVATWR